MPRIHPTEISLIAAALVLPPAFLALQQTSGIRLPSGQSMTPLAPDGARFEALNPHLADAPGYTAGQAVTTVTSPDHRTLLVLTSGYNLLRFTAGPEAGKANRADSNEYVFVYDIAGGAPQFKQVLKVPNTYSGIAFSPAGDAFYVTGGVNDNLHAFARRGDTWTEDGAPVELGHQTGLGIATKPEAAGLAVSADGNTIVVADYENDAISLLGKSPSGWSKTGELDLRPGTSDPNQHGVAGGAYPYAVAIKGNDAAYVSSVRDREVVVVSLKGAPAVTGRIKVPGQPNRMVLNRAQSRLYVAQDNSDMVAVIDTAANRVTAEIGVTAPADVFADSNGYKGAAPNALALAPDENTLYVSNGGENAIAVVDLKAGANRVAGLIPTGWYPNSVSLSGDGNYFYVVNGKSDSPANPANILGLTPELKTPARAANQYILQSDKAGLQSFPRPNDRELQALTRQVMVNDQLLRKPSDAEVAVMAALHQNIHHVIYIIKENRTYDQVLGDLPGGNGDPALAEFPRAVTPNFHALAGATVNLDNFYCSGEVSGDGWPWSTSARTTDVTEKEIPVDYANRGTNDDSEGTNRGVNVGLPTAAVRRQANARSDDDDDDLPGTGNVAAPDGPGGEAGTGYLWDAVLRRHLSVRNYGFWLDLARYNARAADAIPELPDPAASHTQVAISTSPELRPFTDPYFRGFDQNMADFYKYREWAREFDQYAAAGNLPNLELVRMEHDHFGNFGTALAGLSTPELQIADDDYAVGLLVQKVAHSRYKDDTLIFILEDDAQDGADHVDAHRSPAFIVGPFVKHGAVISTPYNTVSLIRTMEEVLGTAPLNLNDAAAAPMTGVFDLNQKTWDYTATPSALLRNSTLPIPTAAFGDAPALTPTHDGAYWASRTVGMDFSVEDHLDVPVFNQLLWDGLMRGQPYPTRRSGADLRSASRPVTR